MRALNRISQIFVAAAAVFLFTAESGLARQTNTSTSKVEKLLRDFVEVKKKSPAVVAGIIDEHGSQVFSCGKLSGDSDVRVDGNTVFEIGSITKTFTATLLEQMAERGELSLDDPAQKFLPDSVKMPTRDGKQITLRDLATHTSGLPRMPGNFAPKDRRNPYADYTVQQMYDFLSGYKLPRDIGAKYEYSNLGVGLLGHILSLKAGTNYEALVIKEICKPLKMHDTQITLTPEMRERLAVGHNADGKPVHNWDIPTFAGAGALRSTVNDMLKYAAANLGLNESPLSATMKKAHVAQRPGGSKSVEIALAWHILKNADSPILMHNGATGGYHAFIGLDEKSRRGVVVLANTANDIDFIGRSLLADSQTNEAPPHKVVEVDYNLYDRYVGKYELAPEIFFTVTRKKNQLFAQLTGQDSFEIFPESPTKFFYRVVDAQLTFLTNNTREVTSLVLHQNGLDQEAEKIK